MGRDRNRKTPKQLVIAELLESSDDESDEESVDDNDFSKKDISTAGNAASLSCDVKKKLRTMQWTIGKQSLTRTPQTQWN